MSQAAVADDWRKDVDRLQAARGRTWREFREPERARGSVRGGPDPHGTWQWTRLEDELASSTINLVSKPYMWLSGSM